jgi:hypothetical protein
MTVQRVAILIAALVAALSVAFVGAFPHAIDPKPGVQPDGDHVSVHGQLYWIADDGRPACFLIDGRSVFLASIAQYHGNGQEIAC